MRLINIHEAKTNLSRILEDVAHGDDVVIAKAGQPIARLTAVSAEKPLRRFGTLKGKISMADDFDAPLPPDLQASFEGK